MRTKDEILSYARRDIQDDTQKGAAPLWLEVRKLEVLIDIRDSLVISKNVLTSIYDSIINND